MNKNRRWISVLMLFVFAMTSLKVLFSTTEISKNCNEFAHIHFYHSRVINQNDQSKKQIENSMSAQGTQEDESCHEGKSLLSYSLLPAFKINFPETWPSVSYDNVWSLDNNFLAPYIESPRKPPKVV